MTNEREHLVLIGAGHAHVAVLADWIERGLPCARATLLTPHSHLRYSGTVPGWIAGQYARDTGTVDVASLAKRAGVQWVQGMCARIDSEAKRIEMVDGATIEFDYASIDTGGVGRAGRILGNDPRLIDIRPIDAFVEQMAQMNLPPRIAIVGGGAGGVELAFALRNTSGTDTVTLVSGADGLLPDFAGAVRNRVRRALKVQAIRLVECDARIQGGVLSAGDQLLEPVDLIIAALGSAAPDWPRGSGLACDEAGFVAVDRHQRSTSHAHIFAVGDVASRQDLVVPHSGVHAVHSGPILAANLRAVMAGVEPSASYTPRPTNLYLISTGDGSAIGSYGPFSAQGRWVAKLKHWIDKRWLSQYADLAKDV